MVKNKLTHCVTLDPDVSNRIDTVGHGKSFSAKIEWIVREYCADRGILVQYCSDQERETGQPTIRMPGAERVWAWAPWLKGPEEHLAHREAESVMRDWAVGQKSRKMKPKEVALGLSAVLQEAGYVVQVLEDTDADILEVWIAKRERTPECGSCQVVQRIRRVLEREAV